VERWRLFPPKFIVGFERRVIRHEPGNDFDQHGRRDYQHADRDEDYEEYSDAFWFHWFGFGWFECH
jgi:hypothetical protein